LPSIDISHSFNSIQLDREFRQLGLGLDEHLAANEAPPNKRRKLHSKQSLSDEIIANLCSLLGSQNATDLAGLSQIAEYINPRYIIHQDLNSL
jgi:hypothetical protein